MKLTKIDDATGKAPKLDGRGSIDYCLWNDENEELYVQFVDNDKSGTYSDLVFSVSEYGKQRDKVVKLGKLNGYDTKTGKLVTTEDNNNGAFLKAVLRQLLAEDDADKS